MLIKNYISQLQSIISELNKFDPNLDVEFLTSMNPDLSESDETVSVVVPPTKVSTPVNFVQNIVDIIEKENNDILEYKTEFIQECVDLGLSVFDVGKSPVYDFSVRVTLPDSPLIRNKNFLFKVMIPKARSGVVLVYLIKDNLVRERLETDMKFPKDVAYAIKSHVLYAN